MNGADVQIEAVDLVGAELQSGCGHDRFELTRCPGRGDRCRHTLRQQPGQRHSRRSDTSCDSAIATRSSTSLESRRVEVALHHSASVGTLEIRLGAIFSGEEPGSEAEVGEHCEIVAFGHGLEFGFELMTGHEAVLRLDRHRLRQPFGLGNGQPFAQPSLRIIRHRNVLGLTGTDDLIEDAGHLGDGGHLIVAVGVVEIDVIGLQTLQ
jgi:hypothetical protein